MNGNVIRLVFGLLLASLLVGCSSGPQLTEVEGIVTYNGRGMADLRVEFLPDPDKKTTGPRSTGVTDSEGRFKLTCDNQKSGAVVGMHRVVITDEKQWEGLKPTREDADKPLKPSRIPDRYADAVKTPFTAIEVKPGGPPIKLEMTGP